jgi:internalin A
VRTALRLLTVALLLTGCQQSENKPTDANAKPQDPPARKPRPAPSADSKADLPKAPDALPTDPIPDSKQPKDSAQPPSPPPAKGNSPEAAALLAEITRLNGYENTYGRKAGDPIHFQFRDPGPTDADLEKLRPLLLESPTPVYLNLNQCPSISDAGVAHLKDVPTLRRLALGGTKVTDAGLKTIGGLTQLDELYLSGDAITDAGVAHLAKLTKLKKLSVYSKAVTDAAFAHLADMTEMEELHVGSRYDFDDNHLKHMAKMSKLQKLSVGGEKLTDAGLAYLKGMTELRELRVDGEKITAAGLAHLAALTKLQMLTITRSQGANGEALAALTGMKDLQELALIYTPAIDKAGGAHVGKLTSLKRLRFGTATADGLAGITGLTGLEDLDLNYSNIGDDGMNHLAGLTGLKYLNLYATRVTEAGLKHLSGLTALKRLNITENKQITDAALAPLAALPNLETLWASDCKITGSGLKELAKHAKLRELSVSGNPITDEHVLALKDLKTLQDLNLTGTKVSDEVAIELKKANPKLRVRDAAGDEVALDKKPRPKPKVEDISKVEPDFKLTADAFYKEYEADRAAATKKYKDKVIELSGEVDGMGRNISGDSHITLKVEKQLIGVMCVTADEQPWAKAVKGQKVKIKGKWPEFSVGAALIYCVFVETGEYKGIPITAAELAKEFAADGEATVKKYEGKILVLTGEVVAKEFNSAGAAGIELKSDNKVKVKCSFTATEKDVTKPIKVGQKLTVVGEFTLNFANRDEVGLYFCLPVTKP